MRAELSLLASFAPLHRPNRRLCRRITDLRASRNWKLAYSDHRVPTPRSTSCLVNPTQPPLRLRPHRSRPRLRTTPRRTRPHRGSGLPKLCSNTSAAPFASRAMRTPRTNGTWSSTTSSIPSRPTRDKSSRPWLARSATCSRSAGSKPTTLTIARTPSESITSRWSS